MLAKPCVGSTQELIDWKDACTPYEICEEKKSAACGRYGAWKAIWKKRKGALGVVGRGICTQETTRKQIFLVLLLSLHGFLPEIWQIGGVLECAVRIMHIQGARQYTIGG